jgi:hypothetical protein
MHQRELQDLLRDLLEELMYARDDVDDPLAELAERTRSVRQIRTFDDAGVLTTDKGIVIECDDDREYQVTIVRSR